MLSSNPTSAQNQSTDFIGDLKNWWNTCPLFTRSVIFVSTVICLLSLVSDIALFLINIPKQTIEGFQITRLIFGPFTFFTIAELLLAFLAYLPLCAEQEKRWGTLKTLIDFFLKNLEVNLLFIVICYILSLISSYFLDIRSYGLWGIFFTMLIGKFLENTEGVTMFLCSPFQIRTKYYPIALFVLFSIISEEIRFDIIIASLAGLLNHRFLNIYYEEFLNDRKISAWETSSIVTWLRTLPHYMSLGSMPGALIDSFDHGMTGTGGAYGPPPGNSGYKGFDNSKAYGQMDKDIEDLAEDVEKQ